MTTGRSAWQAQNLAAIRARLERAAGARNGILFEHDGGDHHTLVFKKGRQVLLYFGQGARDKLALTGIMSRVDVYKPLVLLGRYTQVMMLALLWKPAPLRIYVAGFGGGRMPMILHHWFPELIIESTEIDPAIVAIAEQYFGVRLDDRMSVSSSDAFDYFANNEGRGPYDFISIDCYTGAGVQPNSVASEEYYTLCKERLSPGGVVVANIDLSDPALAQKSEAFTRSFAHVRRYNDGTANVFFGSEEPLEHDDIRARADQLTQQIEFGFSFKQLAAQLR